MKSTAITTPSSSAFAYCAVPRLATFSFNFLQLGLVLHVARSIPSERGSVILLLAFEIGILIDCLWRRGSVGAWAVVGVVAGLIMLSIQSVLPTLPGLAVCATTVCFLAMALKKIRTATDALGAIKRRWRAFGYLAAGFFDLASLSVLLLLIAILVFASGIHSRRDKLLCAPFRLDRPRLRPYCVVMFHHFHYFAYAYILVFLFLHTFLIPEIAIGPVFYVGWLGYYLFANVNRHQRALVILGHLLSSCAVLLMLGTPKLHNYLVLWFLTGVGGGTIILFREANIDQDEVTYERFKTWESFGHCAGLICLSVAVYVNVNHLALVVSAWAGICCALGVTLTSQSQTKASQ